MLRVSDPKVKFTNMSDKVLNEFIIRDILYFSYHPSLTLDGIKYTDVYKKYLYSNSNIFSKNIYKPDELDFCNDIKLIKSILEEYQYLDDEYRPIIEVRKDIYKKGDIKDFTARELVETFICCHYNYI